MDEGQVERNSEEIRRLRNIIDGNGQPSLRERIMADVAVMLAKDRHNIRGAMDKQGNDVYLELHEEKEAREEQHRGNTKTLEALQKGQTRILVAIGSVGGAWVLIQVLNTLGMIHFGMKQ